jgi:hypothetical protein
MTSLRNRRIGHLGHSFGTAVMYAASSSGFWTSGQGDYEIEFGANSYPKETRAYRKRAKKRGRERELREEALRDEAVVLFGPDVSAKRAIQLLRRVANQIANRGLYTGEDKCGNSAFERKVVQL